MAIHTRFDDSSGEEPGSSAAGAGAGAASCVADALQQHFHDYGGQHVGKHNRSNTKKKNDDADMHHQRKQNKNEGEKYDKMQPRCQKGRRSSTSKVKHDDEVSSCLKSGPFIRDGSDDAKKTTTTTIFSRCIPDGPNKIFIGGIPNKWTELQVLELIETFGHVKRLALPRKKRGRASHNNQGYCFVEYADPNITEVACSGMNGMEIEGGKILGCNVAISKNRKKRHSTDNIITTGMVSSPMQTTKEECSLLAAASNGDDDIDASTIERISTSAADHHSATSRIKREAPSTNSSDADEDTPSSSSRKRVKSSDTATDNANNSIHTLEEDDNSSKTPPCTTTKSKQSTKRAQREQNLMELTAKQSLQTKFPHGCRVMIYHNKRKKMTKKKKKKKKKSDDSGDDDDEDEVVVSIGTVDTVYFDLSSTMIDPWYEIKEIKKKSDDDGQGGNNSNNNKKKVLFGQDSLAFAPNSSIYYNETTKNDKASVHEEEEEEEEQKAKEGVVLSSSHQFCTNDDGGDDDDIAESSKLRYTLQLKHDDSGKFIIKYNVRPDHVSHRAEEENPSEEDKEVQSYNIKEEE